MEMIVAKCINITLTENRSTVQFDLKDKADNKILTQVAISFTNSKDGAKYEIGKEYSIDIKLL